MKGQVGNKIVQ